MSKWSISEPFGIDGYSWYILSISIPEDDRQGYPVGMHLSVWAQGGTELTIPLNAEEVPQFIEDLTSGTVGQGTAKSDPDFTMVEVDYQKHIWGDQPVTTVTFIDQYSISVSFPIPDECIPRLIEMLKEGVQNLPEETEQGLRFLDGLTAEAVPA